MIDLSASYYPSEKQASKQIRYYNNMDDTCTEMNQLELEC